MSCRFPLFVDLSGRPVVVVGAGAIACRRMGALLSFGADILVVAPKADPWVEDMERALGGPGCPGRLRWERREYRGGDLAGAFLALAATDDRKVNRLVGLDARRLGIPVNVCDRKEESDFYFPGIARRGGVVVGVTAGGADHGLARRVTEAVRELLERLW